MEDVGAEEYTHQWGELHICVIDRSRRTAMEAAIQLATGERPLYGRSESNDTDGRDKEADH